MVGGSNPSGPAIIYERSGERPMINKLQRWWRNLVSFLRETRAELKKVVWPSWGEVRTLTAIVVLTMVGIGTILWGTDGLLSLLVGLALR